MDERSAVTVDAGVAADFAALGVPVPPGAVAEDEAMGIWPDNWPSLLAWLGCETQWRVHSTFGGLRWVGLDYNAVDVVMRRLRFDDDVFHDLQDMERAALEILMENS